MNVSKVIHRPKEGRAKGLTGLQTFRPYLYLLPAFAFLGLFIFYPLFRTFEISLYDWNLVNPKRTFVGLENYQRWLFEGQFLQLVWQSALYLLFAVIGTFLFPVGLALLTLQVREREAAVYQSLLFLPTVVAVSVGVLVWTWLYLPVGGLFNTLLSSVGMRGPSWLSEATTALPAVSLVATWKFFGFNYLVALAGLRAIPKDYLDAAKVDGAEGGSLLRFVLLPMFAPTLLFLFVSSLVQALDHTFVVIDILTEGGPFNTSNNLMYAVYQESFKFFRAGQGAAAAIVLVAVFAVFIIWQFRLLEKSVSYDR